MNGNSSGPSTLQCTRTKRARIGPRRVVGKQSKRRGGRTRTYRLGRKRRPTYNLAKIAKKVSWNAQKLHGDLQTNMQIAVFPTLAGPDIRDKYPVLLNLTDFTSDNTSLTMPNDQMAALYKMRTSGPASHFVSKAGYWARKDFTGLNQLATKYSAWNKCNADVPDTGKYYAVSSQYRLTFNVTGTCRIRIQIFAARPRMIMTYSDLNELQLPTGMDGLSQMCTGNQLSRKYFKLYKQVEKVLDPSNNQTSSDVVLNFAFHHNKKIQQALTNPAVAPTNPQGTLAPATTGQDDASGIYNVVNGEWFQPSNITQGTPFWMLISSDVTGVPQDPPQVGNQVYIKSFTRIVKWRDHVG